MKSKKVSKYPQLCWDSFSWIWGKKSVLNFLWLARVYNMEINFIPKRHSKYTSNFPSYLANLKKPACASKNKTGYYLFLYGNCQKIIFLSSSPWLGLKFGRYCVKWSVENCRAADFPKKRRNEFVCSFFWENLRLKNFVSRSTDLCLSCWSSYPHRKK